MNWSDQNPGSGEPAEIRAAAFARRDKATEIEEHTRRPLFAAVNEVVSGSWKAHAATAFVARTLTALRDIDPLIDGLKGEADALLRYAARVDSIKSAAVALRCRISDAQDDYDRLRNARDDLPSGSFLGLSSNLESSSPEHQLLTHKMESEGYTLMLLGRQWDELVDDRRRADQECATAISGCQAVAPVPRNPDALADASSGELFMLLSSLSVGGLAALLQENPELVQQFWNTPPSPDRVAAWWKGLDAATKQALITDCSSVIGNLPGIDNQSRMDANKHAFDQAYANQGPLTDPQKKALDDIHAALASGDKKAPGGASDFNYGLLDFNIGANPPLAAVVLGDLVGASANGKVSIFVPGMYSIVGGDGNPLKSYTLAAQNLLGVETNIDRTGTYAVVAWIGYKAPDMASVFQGTLAAEGATRFAAELDGQYAQTTTFTANPNPYTAVVAHSYGTTLAADALTQTHHDVAAVVFVASAGIDQNIVHDANAMNITDGAHNLYKTHAADDQIAPIGIVGSGRQNPNHPTPALGILQPQFGGNQFSSDGAPGYLRATAHDALGGGIFDFDHTGHGYFDLNTESLQNIAAAASGHPSKIVGSHPYDAPRARL